MIFSRKNTLKDDISGIIEKVDIHPEKYISSDRNIKDDEKVYFYKKKVPMILCTFIENFIGVFIYCFSMEKKTRNLMCGIKT